MKEKKKTSKAEMIQIKVPVIERPKNAKEGMYEFLYVPMAIDLDVLEKEIKAGVKQFRHLPSLQEEDSSRYTVIEADNEEEGYLAVTFAYAIQREMDIRKAEENYGECESEEDDEDEWPEETCNQKKLAYLTNSLEYLTKVTMPDVMWWVNRVRNGGREVPIGFSMMMGNETNQKEPYWLELGDKPILIVINEYELRGFMNRVLPDVLRYFENSVHVYLLVIRDEESNPIIEEYDDDEVECSSIQLMEEDGCLKELTQITLELTSDYVSVRTSEAERKIYRQRLMESWLKSFDFTDYEGSEWLVDCVVRLNREKPSEYMEKMLKLVRRHYPKDKKLTKEMLQKLGLVNERIMKDGGASLDSLVGMEAVKEQILSVVNVLKFRQALKACGKRGAQYHNVFLFQGAPGTAKTTVAKAFGQLLAEERLLRNDRFISVSGSQLKAGYLGQTSARVHKLFQDNDIILIDEAYSLAPKMNGEIDIYASEALAQLAVELEEHATDKVVIFAGYGGDSVSDEDDKMSEFLKTNPGIRSRINFTITFPSYTAKNMLEIVHFMANEQDLNMVHTADQEIIRYFENRCMDRAFGNGREARSFIENAVRITAERYALEKFPEDGNIVLTKKDILKTIQFMQAGYGKAVACGKKYGLVNS